MLRSPRVVSDPSYEFTPCPICGAHAATEIAGAVLRSAHRVLRAGDLLSLRVSNGTFYRRWRTRCTRYAARVLRANRGRRSRRVLTPLRQRTSVEARMTSVTVRAFPLSRVT